MRGGGMSAASVFGSLKLISQHCILFSPTDHQKYRDVHPGANTHMHSQLLQLLHTHHQMYMVKQLPLPPVMVPLCQQKDTLLAVPTRQG